MISLIERATTPQKYRVSEVHPAYPTTTVQSQTPIPNLSQSETPPESLWSNQIPRAGHEVQKERYFLSGLLEAIRRRGLKRSKLGGLEITKGVISI